MSQSFEWRPDDDEKLEKHFPHPHSMLHKPIVSQVQQRVPRPRLPDVLFSKQKSQFG
jgi:hypothetical protein